MSALHFDIDTRELTKVSEELGATPKQIKLAFSRALSRTAATLRKLSQKGLKDELQLRTLKFLRVRLKSIKLRGMNLEGMKLWYGLNDMPVGEFKGMPKATTAGAEFRGTKFKGGFVGKNKRRQPTIFKRKGAARLPLVEQELPVKDKMDVFIEDKIFDQAEAIFWKHFKADLNARVKYQLGES